MVFWQDQDMTMPGYDDGTPSLAEIGRMLKDFRDEWRQGVQELVRKDVYNAHIANLENKIAVLEKQIVATNVTIDKAEQNSRFKQNLLYGTAITTGVSLLAWILTQIIQAS
jgi:hypothetical protein